MSILSKYFLIVIYIVDFISMISVELLNETE